MGVYRWLEENGLWFEVVGWATAGVLGFLAGRFSKTWKAFRHALHQQPVIADRLDTTTPGGLGDIAAKLDVLPAATAGQRPNDKQNQD